MELSRRTCLEQTALDSVDGKLPGIVWRIMNWIAKWLGRVHQATSALFMSRAVDLQDRNVDAIIAVEE